MKFLFETITLAKGKPAYYCVYGTGANRYYAEGESGLNFSWNGEWVADVPCRQHEAEQIGEVIDRRGWIG